MATAVSGMSGRGLSGDALLGVMAHGTLAFGLVGVSFLQGNRIDLNRYLFGDILAVSPTDLGVIWGGVLIILGLLWWRWSALLTSTMGEDLAFAAGINPRREQFVLTVALALVVAVAIKVVGALLIAALLIIPAASALAGLGAAFAFDTPTGPTIVSLAAVFFTVPAMTRLVWGVRGT